MVLLGVGPNPCPAHEQLVHRQISYSAALSSEGLTNFLVDFLGPQYAPFTNLPPLWLFDLQGRPAAIDFPVAWIQQGSDEEDTGGFYLRSQDHFYTVTPGRRPGLAPGLTDAAETLVLESRTPLYGRPRETSLGRFTH